MEPLKVGIIGLGKVAHLHAKAVLHEPLTQLAAVCSRNTDTVDTFANEYGARGYTDFDAFINESGIEALCICTPHPAHVHSAVAAAEAGIHLLIEKPLASSLQDCDAILDAAAKSGVKVAMVSQRRFYEPCQRVRRAIDEGKIGAPALGTATILGWRDEPYYKSDPWRGSWEQEGGGVLVNQAPHQLDLLLWYMGEIEELFGYWDNLNHPYIEVEDTAMAVIRFKNGGMANVLVSNSFNPAIHGKVQILGTNGALVSVQTDGGQMFIPGMAAIEEPPLNDLWTVPGETDQLESWEREDTDYFKTINATEHYHKVQMRDFAEAIRDDRPPLADGSAGRQVVELFTAIYRSQRDRKPIQFPLSSENDRDDFDGRTPS